MSEFIREAKRLVAYIEAIQGDYEVAHGTEDGAREWFLKEVLSDNHTLEELKEVADILLKTSDLDFARYCA